MILSPFWLPKINTTREFANAEDVEAIGDKFVLYGRGMSQGGKAGTGPQIGEEAKVFSQGKKGTTFGLYIRWKIFPLRPAYRTEENRIGLFAGFYSLLWKGSLVVGSVEGCSAYKMSGLGDFKIKFD